MSGSDRPQVVVVYADGTPAQLDAGTIQHLADRGLSAGQTSGASIRTEVPERPISEFLPEQMSAPSAAVRAADPVVRLESPRVFNPTDVHREFPARWKAYIRANYSNLLHVQQVFGVSDRTARKWWNGETGANGGHVAVAVAEHPIAAINMLFAAE